MLVTLKMFYIKIKDLPMHDQRLKQMSYNHVLSLAVHTDEIQSTIFLSLKAFAVYLK